MNKGRVCVFVCKPYYPDTTNIVWEDEPLRELEDSESVFDIKKKGEETKAGSRDGGKQG